MNSYVFISGATGGLGKAFTVECASRGWNLFLSDMNEEKLHILSHSISSIYNISILHCACDLTDEKSRNHMLEYLRKCGIRFHMLINVAGIDYEGFFMDRTPSQITSVIRLNIESTLVLTHGILGFRDTGGIFRIITVSSLAAFFPMPVKAIYSASKRFLLNFFMALREELHTVNSTVTILCPAGIPTRPEIIQAIETQGILGMITSKNAGYIAGKTLDYALKGKLIYIPGRLNVILKSLGILIPDRIIAYLIGKRWTSCHKKRLSTNL